MMFPCKLLFGGQGNAKHGTVYCSSWYTITLVVRGCVGHPAKLHSVIIIHSLLVNLWCLKHKCGDKY